MEPYKTIVALRLKTHALDNSGHCIPPATEDTGQLLFEIKGLTKNEIKTKTEEFLKKAIEWLKQ